MELLHAALSASTPTSLVDSPELTSSSSGSEEDRASECEEPNDHRRQARQSSSSNTAPIWWANCILFWGLHLFALVGILVLSPVWELKLKTAMLCFFSWQLAIYGITMGYHRLWSHKAYEARLPLRIVLAGMGCLGFQGSIRWWVLRHRLHHRWTDSDDDPYDAQKGLFFSHMGWIFRKPSYPKMPLIERRDLDSDPVVRFQHKYYLPLTLFFGLALPTLLGASWGDAMGGYIYGGVLARIMIWHTTFLINSFAHYIGEQNYSEEVTARTTLILAILTAGEGNHDYHHAFPKDFRNGPGIADYDPTKWVIWMLHRFTSLVPVIYATPEHEILEARAHVLHSKASRLQDLSSDSEAPNSRIPSDDSLPIWRVDEVTEHVRLLTADKMARGSLKRPLVIIVDSYALDVASYASLHPGGFAVLRSHAIKGRDLELPGDRGRYMDASKAFHGGLNDHQWSAREKAKTFRIARVVGEARA
ncbi:hypothetical protein E5Q_01296 [Mixia osmundae IAM 14324]|uniref:Acyl-CoA desaturase n=2 Tax=Mixia osmundae (strain CBS 9802 / IAM 14324 / JCM 22182 / KY 12970) TaxID=764103 RepID=G7DVN3_MIXOS|nr:hypothetical protein E5Q_01296 [Mixia osmundae IAM 14324]